MEETTCVEGVEAVVREDDEEEEEEERGVEDSVAWVRLRDFVLSVNLLLEDLATTGVEELEEAEQGVGWAVCWNRLEGIKKGAEGE